MITSINEWKQHNESLSSDREREAKLQTLIRLGREMLDAYKKADELKELKSIKNTEVTDLLNKLNETSIIAKGTLIEVFKPYTSNRLSSKAYLQFVEESVSTVSSDFQEIHNQIKIAARKISQESTTLRKTANTRNLETGTLKTNEGLSDIWASIVNKLRSWMSKFNKLLNKTQQHLSDIETKAAIFVNITEGSISTADTYEEVVEELLPEGKYDDPGYVTVCKECGVTEIEHLGNTDEMFNFCPECELTEGPIEEITEAEWERRDSNPNWMNESPLESLKIEEGFVDNIYIRDLDENDQDIMLNDMNNMIIKKFGRNSLKIKSALYEISFDLNTLSVNNDENIDMIALNLGIKPDVLISYLDEIISKNKSMFLYDESLLLEDLSEEQRLARNKYSREYKQRKRNIVKVLETAKETIELAEQEEYYKQLAKTNEKMIINLLKEFDAKSIAIDDKILTLVHSPESEVFDFNTYQEKITNAEEVGDAVALMAKALLDVHRQYFEVSGSVRQFKDDTNSPEGTMGATFDYEEKTVKLPESVVNEDAKFNYMMLDRLKQDCEYFLGFGNGNERHLHQLNVEDQIKMMKDLWNGFPENAKPEWLTMEEIEDYEQKMLQMKSDMTNEGVGSWLKVWNKVKSFFSMFKSASKKADIALSKI